MFLYTGVIKHLVHEVKFNNNVNIVAALPTDIVDLFGLDLSQFTHYCFVPSHKLRIRFRGYMPNRVLFQNLIDLKSLKELPILRKKHTKAFYGLNRAQRFLEIQDAFIPLVDSLFDADVLLLDDICTSGATLLELTQLCYNLGARSVTALVLAIEE